VSTANGSLSVNIPVWSLKQKGALKLDFWLAYDAPSYLLDYECQADSSRNGPAGTCQYPRCDTNINEFCSVQWNMSDSPSVISTSPFYYGLYGVRLVASTNIGVAPVIAYSSDGLYVNGFYWNVQTPDGGSHNLASTTTGDFRAVDGTGWEYQPQSCTLQDQAGVKYVFTCQALSNPTRPPGLQFDPGALQYVQDANGNTITLRSHATAEGTVFDGWTDSMGRIVPGTMSPATSSQCPSGSASASTWQPPDSQVPVTFCGTTINYSTNLFSENLWGGIPPSLSQDYIEAQGSVGSIGSVILPSGDRWGFQYDSLAANQTGTAYGALTDITLPTGGRIHYVSRYTANICGVHPSASTARAYVTERDIYASSGSTSPAQWLYSGKPAPQTASPITSTVTDPYQNKTTYTLQVQLGCGFYPTSVAYSDASQNLIKTETMTYQLLAPLDLLSFYMGSGSSALQSGVAPSSKATIWPDGLQDRVDYTYDLGFTSTDVYLNPALVSLGRETSESVYDFGSGSAGPLLRKKTTSYWASNGSTPFADNLILLPSQEVVTDGATSKQHATTYSYDDFSLTSAGVGAPYWSAVNGSVHGNLTKVSRFLDTSNSNLTTQMTYFDTGMMASLKLPSNVPNPDTTTTFTYSPGSQQGLLASVTDSLTHTQTYGYDAMLRLTSKTDPNNATTNISYTSDSRLASIVNPPDSNGNRGETDYSYPSSNEVDKSVKQDGSTWVSSHSLFDGLGRPSESQLLNGCSGGGPILADTSYDLMDRVYSQTNPYCSTPDATTYHASTAGGLATTGYDALSRPIAITLQDGNTQSWSYSDNTTTFTDEASSQWSRTADALGRLTSVVEPGNLPTHYGYDGFGNLLTVNQVGNAALNETPRLRSFTYDSLSRLLTAMNPETGTVCYGQLNGGNCQSGYDAHGNLLSKTDGSGVLVSYSYDALNRMLTKTTPGDWATNYSFTYDQGANGIGRLSKEQDTAGTSAQVTSGTGFQYDALGRTTSTQWINFVTGQWQAGMQVSYDLAGNVTQLTYPDGRSVSQVWDGAGRLSSIQEGTSGTGTYYASGMQYGPSGALETESLANGTVTQSVSLNSRLQPCRQTASSSLLSAGGSNFLDHQLYYSFPAETNCGVATSNNGNIHVAINGLDMTSETFTYDGLNRLHEAYSLSRPTVSTYHQIYNNDSFGNMRIVDQVHTAQNYGIDSATNRLTLNGDLNTGDLRYNANGTLAASPDGLGGYHSYMWTGEGYLRCVDSCNNGSYIYNSFGERTLHVRSLNVTPVWFELVYLNGRPMAELDNNGVWTDHIYANGTRIAQAPSVSAAGSVTIRFSNDSCTACTNQSPYQDRNLYVTGIAVNGVAVDLTSATNSTSCNSNGTMLCNGDMTIQMPVSGPIQVTAYGSPDAGAYPHMQVLVDGVQVGQWDITGSSQTYSIGSSAVLASQTKFYLADQVGTTQMELGADGSVLWQGWFTPFGQEIINGGEQIIQGQVTPDGSNNRYKFTGKERDAESGLDYFGARYYASNMGRWMSPDWSAKEDPVPYAKLDDPQTLNLYGYVRNNPLSMADPDGHCPPGQDCGKVTVTATTSGNAPLTTSNGGRTATVEGTVQYKFTYDGKPLTNTQIHEDISNKSSRDGVPEKATLTTSDGPTGPANGNAPGTIPDTSSISITLPFGGAEGTMETSVFSKDTTQTLTFQTPTGSSCSVTETRTLTNADSRGGPTDDYKIKLTSPATQQATPAKPPPNPKTPTT